MTKTQLKEAKIIKKDMLKTINKLHLERYKKLRTINCMKIRLNGDLNFLKF